MKLKYIYVLAAALALAGCTDLVEKPYSSIPSDEYGKTPSEVATIVGRAYASLRGGASDGVNFFPTSEFVFFVQAIASDECVIPTRATGDWYDDGYYQQIQRHLWTPDNTKLWSLWKYGYNGVASINSIIYQVEQSGLSDEASRPIYAELRALRAYYYYLLLDWYGNVPLEVSFDVKEAPGTSPRAEVYAFVEKELTENIAYLPTEGYGRMTQNAANLLLARLYLNSEAFGKGPRWQECLDVCGRISGVLATDWFANFKTENQTSPEIIFAIPYDRASGTAGNFLSSMSMNYDQMYVISAAGNYQWSGNGICAQPGLWSSFEQGDLRRGALMEGPQTDKRTGQTLITGQTGVPLIYTEEIVDFESALENEGVRLRKYEMLEGEQWERDHDLVVMRYAEVLMMQAECHARLGNMAAARPYIEQVRQRAGLSTPENVDLKLINDELRHEFVFESHRRTDNIRFGDFFGEWWAKPADAADRHTALFPIPAQEIAKNGKLVQNPGYSK